MGFRTCVICLCACSLAVVAASNGSPTISGAAVYMLGGADDAADVPDINVDIPGDLLAGDYFDTNGVEHPAFWTPQNTSGTDLLPSSYTSGGVNALNASQQVGTALTSSYAEHAMLWNSSATNYVDLNSSSFTESEAVGIAANQQVGGAVDTASPSSPGTRSSGRDRPAITRISIPAPILAQPQTPPTAKDKSGTATPSSTTAVPHAALWSGSANTFIDLNPAGYSQSTAKAISPDGTQQVGLGVLTGSSEDHALVGTGSAAAFADLNPTGYDYSLALGTDGTYQVGYAVGSNTDDYTHAMLWSGTADSYVDLQNGLPSDLIDSEALSIADNVIYGFADDANGNRYAVEWSLPEPSTLALASLSIPFLRRRSRRS